MARTEITINTIPFQGTKNPVVYTAADATNDHQFDNDGNTLLLVKNGGGGAVAVTVTSVDDEFGRSEDIVESVGAAADATFGPFIQSIWNQPGAKIFVDLDIDTSVELAAIQFSPRK